MGEELNGTGDIERRDMFSASNFSNVAFAAKICSQVTEKLGNLPLSPRHIFSTRQSTKNLVLENFLDWQDL